ncbi:MAG: TIGR03943 family protein [Clostridiales bacterium]|nr:TIGR03943 family protein [Clostridiales bacterium]
MRLRGKGLNLEALTESASYLIFGALLVRLTISGTYLNYVTPRMKPYLYGLSVLMFFWAAVSVRNLFRPRYKSRIKRCMVLILPILLLAVPPSSPTAGAMVKGGAGISRSTPVDTTQASDEYAYYGQDALEKPEDTLEEEQNYESQEAQPDNQAKTPPPGLNGLNKDTKTITISDEDFSPWITELSNHPEAYDGYTVTLKGFVYLDLEDKKENEFAVVRLSMWCCSADLAPMGLVAVSNGKLPWEENSWITVTGKLAVKDGYATLEAEKIEAAEKPSEEYVYPYY